MEEEKEESEPPQWDRTTQGEEARDFVSLSKTEFLIVGKASGYFTQIRIHIVMGVVNGKKNAVAVFDLCMTATLCDVMV